VAPIGSSLVSPAQPPPSCSVPFSLLANTYCWPVGLYFWTCPPNRQAALAPAAQPGKMPELNLKTNHQSTGWPFFRSGTGALCENAQNAVNSNKGSGLASGIELPQV
jgi:hypothetical protein